MFYEEEENMTDDEDLIEFAVLIAFPKRKKIFRNRPDHFTALRDDEFIDRFRLSKTTVH